MTTGRGIAAALGAWVTLATAADARPRNGAMPAPTAAGQRFVLHRLRFTPSRFLSPAALRRLGAPYVGRSVSTAELAAIVAAADALYDGRGIVTARARLGAVDAARGRVTVELVEGRVGRITVTGNRRLPAATAIARAGLVAGAVVDPPALQRRLSLLNRATDTRYRVALQPGAAFGTTDAALTLTPPGADTVQLAADNQGYDSAGRYEGSVYYRRAGLFGASDRLTTYLSGSHGLLSGSASYDAAPFDALTRIALAYGHSRTDIVSGPYAALGSRAVIDAVSLSVSHPILAGEHGLLTATLLAGLSGTRRSLAGVDTGRSRTRRIGGGLQYDLVAARTSVAASIDAVYADAPAGPAAATQGFAVVTGTLAAEQLVGGALGLRLTGGWQVASVAYVPGDLLFQIGGATTVRGYRQGELTGDGGYHLGAEAEWFALRHSAASLRLFAFADQGRVFTDYPPPRALAAAGVGAAATIGRHLDLRLTLGAPLRRIGDEGRAVQAFGRVALTF